MSTSTGLRSRLATRTIRGAAAVLTVGLLLAACGSSTNAGKSIDNSRASIYFAEGPGANPNYIFPYMGCAYFSVSNINQFQLLMYRPVYWFGLGHFDRGAVPAVDGREADVLRRGQDDHDGP